MAKTNAMRLLEQAKIPYTIKQYTVDEEHLSGRHAAAEVGLSPDEVFKTLVTRGDKTGICVFCVPVSGELNLKKAAAASGNKKIELVPMKEVLPLTGYLRGGCSPIGMKKSFPTYLNETAVLFDQIAISAGVRGTQIIINPETLHQFLSAPYHDLTD